MPKVAAIENIMTLDTGGDPYKSPFSIILRGDDNISYHVLAKKEDRWKPGDEFVVKKVREQGTNNHGQYIKCSISSPQYEQQNRQQPSTGGRPEHVGRAVERAVPVETSEAFFKRITHWKLDAYFKTREAGLEMLAKVTGAKVNAPLVTVEEIIAFAREVAGPSATMLDLAVKEGRVMLKPTQPSPPPADDTPPLTDEDFPAEQDEIPF